MTRLLRELRSGLLVAGLLAGCTGPGATGPPPSAPPDGVVIVATALAFDRSELGVPAGRPFPLLFENREGAPHNVAIYVDDPAAPLFAGEVFGGPASRTYAVPALEAGTYRFRCDVHPEMAGAVVAG
jgi:plastocyanin